MSALSLNQLTSVEASANVSPSTTMKRNRPKTARIKTTKFRKTGFEGDEENDGAPPSKKPAPIFPSHDFLTTISSNNNETNCSSKSVEQLKSGEASSSNNIPQQSTFVETSCSNRAYDQSKNGSSNGQSTFDEPCSSKIVFEKSTLDEKSSSNEQSTFGEPCSSKNVFEKSTLAENSSSNEQSILTETFNSNNNYEPLNEVVAAVPVIVTPITDPSDFLTTKKISKVYFADEVGRKLAEITICERYIVNKSGKKACFEHGKEGIHLAKAFQRYDGSEDNNLYSLISENEEEGEIISSTTSTESIPPNDRAFNTPKEAYVFHPNTAVATATATSTSNGLKHFHDRLCVKKESFYSSHSKYGHSFPSRNHFYGSSYFSKGHELKNYDDSRYHLPSRDYRRSPARDYHHSTSSDKYHGRSHYRSSLFYEKNKNFYQSHYSPARTFRRSPARDYHHSSPRVYRRSSPCNYYRSTSSDKYHGRSQYRSPISYEKKKNDDYSYHRRRNSPIKNFSHSLPRDSCY